MHWVKIYIITCDGHRVKYTWVNRSVCQACGYWLWAYCTQQDHCTRRNVYIKWQRSQPWPMFVCAVCEPDSIMACSRDSRALCCDSSGRFLTTAVSCLTQIPYLNPQTFLGFCNRGGCASHMCKSIYDGMSLDIFCGTSDINPCKASCSSSSYDKCYDTATFPDGGENLDDGAVCSKDRQKGAFIFGAYTIDLGLWCTMSWRRG